MTIKPLDGHVVLCEDPGCGKPAVYLFTQPSPVMWCAAYCDVHGLRVAEDLRVSLPKGRLAEPLQAIAGWTA
jgi:hypothetical protein